jgi:2-(1,2-epoxy-1,2-dihydrophenyl)acetyl-CoA isomerase
VSLPAEGAPIGPVPGGGTASPAAGLESWREGPLLWLRINRPERRNAIDLATAVSIEGALAGADPDPAVRAIVIIGSGRDFCTGGDFSGPSVTPPSGPAASGGSASPLDYRWPLMPFQQLFRTLWEVEKPVVSAVNGTVAGIGWMLALLADFPVAAEGVRWTHAFARRGMMPHGGDTVFLARVLPFRFLTEVAMLSETVTSETLAEWRALSRLVPPDEVEAVARELAERLAAGPTRSLGQAKRLYRRSLLRDVDAALDDERAATALISTTSDRLEGTRAFGEGRQAVFTGE